MNSPAGFGRVAGPALALFAALFLIYNANGRELQPVDSQPTKLAARALARDGVLTLDRDVAEKPGLADRPSFQKDLQGHTRSAYSVVPSIIAAGPAWILSRTGLLDLDAPLAPNIISALTASIVTAAAVALLFLTIARLVPTRVALYTAIGLGVGTNFWPEMSRTLWQHETVALGEALALWASVRPTADLKMKHFAIAGIGLALAVTCRLQVVPLAAILLLWMWRRAGFWRPCLSGMIVTIACVVLFVAQYRWFGDPLGGFASMQKGALTVNSHGVTDSISRTPWTGALGLLLSPSRGIIIFSPVVLLILPGIRRSLRAHTNLRLGWLLAASGGMFILYGGYSVWWGGFTFGPRYMLDLLVPLAPAAALGTEVVMCHRWARRSAAGLLAWSIVVAMTGAFVYPNDNWNPYPKSVDTHHDRLWDWRDPQIVRAWKRGLSPQNFDLFNRAAFRSPTRATGSTTR
jgi:hypothetical protein